MNYIIADTEGSGLFDYTKPADAPGQPRVAAVGLILTDGNLEVQQEHSFLIKPNGWTFDNNSDAAKVNGLTHERLMDEGVGIEEALRIYGGAIDDRRIIVGFNVLHDLKSLRAELRHAGLPDRYMQSRYICCMQGCRKTVDARTEAGKKKAPKLAEACAYYGIEQGGDGHTAIGDARSALEILRRLRDADEFPAVKDPYERGKD